MTDSRARDRTRAAALAGRIAVLAVAPALLLGPGAGRVAAAGTVTRRVAATKTIEIKYDPATSSRCAEAEFVRWPVQPYVKEGRAKIFYTHLGVEEFEEVDPPYDDDYVSVNAPFPVPTGQHQWKLVSGVAETFNGTTADCSGLQENSEEWYAGPVRVELEVTYPPLRNCRFALHTEAGLIKLEKAMRTGVRRKSRQTKKLKGRIRQFTKHERIVRRRVRRRHVPADVKPREKLQRKVEQLEEKEREAAHDRDADRRKLKKTRKKLKEVKPEAEELCEEG